MDEMFDCDGKRIHEGELIIIVNRPDIVAISADYWTIFDVLVYGVYTDFVLKNCVTNEILILPQSNIKRTY
jgi:hypothetical protein